jgi:hypothetical protein
MDANQMTSLEIPNIIIKKEIVSLFIESPLYFTMPLQKRLELVTQYGERRSHMGLKNCLINWIETGNFLKPTVL